METFHIMYCFQLSSPAFVIRDGVQNESWFYYLNRYGVAFVKSEKDMLIFDTFILPAQLKPKQKQIVLNHLDTCYTLKNIEYFALIQGLMQSPIWSEFVDVERGNKLLKEYDEMVKVAYKNNPKEVGDSQALYKRTLSS